MSAPIPDIGCGHFLGDTCCVLPWKHDGDHQPADTVVVDRNLRPINRRRVRVGDRREVEFAEAHEYRGKVTVTLCSNVVGDDHRIAQRVVSRPAVRVGDRWPRRMPDLEVVARG